MSTRSRLSTPQRALLAGICVVGLVAVLDVLFPPPLERAAEVSAVVTDRGGRPLRAFPIAEGRWRMRADVDRIDPKFLAALIAVEDRRFYRHPGVDPLAVARAAWSAARSRRIVSGGSTITMQAARLLEPRPRTIGAKLIEMMRALQIERRLTKREILELYLTLTPYGGNLEGVRAASWAYFGRESERLTPDEIALLIALPQAPEARRPDLRPAAATAARRRVLTRLTELGQIDAGRAAEAAKEPAPSRHPFPAVAWHAADEARRRAPGAATIRTTLDAALQADLERLARRQAAEVDAQVQVSILVVEVDGRAVRAAVGSAGRDRPGGWIDLTDRPRSPGSALKPFIYALALDDGLATPQTLIDDAPRRFAAYRPENFDHTFRGEVTLTQALQHSLNVPAVQALDAVGEERFAAALSFAGAAPQLTRGADRGAGLALALGGAGMSARQLAVLYAALADGGRARPLTWLEGETSRVMTLPGYPLVSPAAAATVSDILRRAPHPAGRMPAALTRGAPSIAFKTGTSYGYRDAWAAGVTAGHAIVVWVGRADGVPRPGATGREAALPILFDVADRVATTATAPSTEPHESEAPRSDPPPPLARFGGPERRPEILFPPDGAEIWHDRPDRGFVLAARGREPLSWFVDGARVARDAAGAPVWIPQGPGFYTVTAVDPRGASARATVRVRTPS